MKLVLASGNPGKLRELAALLAPLGHEVIAQSALSIESPPETGTTFEANALIKARHAAAFTGLPALADDSGIEVDALGGRPGVYSARYAGEHATDAQNLKRMLEELQGVSLRTARYQCVITLVREASDPRPLIATGRWEGHILESPRGTGGFGYDPIFVPEGLKVSAAELPAAQKNQMSHRAQAMRALSELLCQI